MTYIDQLADQHILEYESRQKHVGELLVRARAQTGEGPEHADTRSQLEALAQEHGRLSDQLDALKRRLPEDWKEKEIEEAGPMGIWDALAQQAEKLVERLEKKSF